MGKESQTRDKCIDFVRGITIIAVVLDHTFGNLYESEMLRAFTYFAIGTFALMSGINIYSSMERRKIKPFDAHYLWYQTKAVLYPYIAAVVISAIVINRQFDLISILSQILQFNRWPPYYYVFVQLQLILVSQVLFGNILAIKRSKHPAPLYITAYLLVLLLICFFLKKFTFTLQLHGAGQHLFGSTMVFLFAFGMVWKSFHLDEHSSLAVFFFSALFLAVSGYGIINQRPMPFPFFDIVAVNPPGLQVIVYSISIFWFLFLLRTYASKIFHKQSIKLLAPIEICGKYSFSIFLYHNFFIYLTGVFLKVDKIVITNIPLRFLALLSFLFLPICLNKLLSLLRKIVLPRIS